MSFQRAARLDEIPEGRGLCVRFAKLEVGLFRVGAEIHAMENRCPHAGYPLSEGKVRGAIVVCPAHGWAFDVRTGFPPDFADGWPIPRFAVLVKDGEVWVDVSRPINLRGR
jgi:3-phenylpropionate/trans-cinnamate dioxygenase ferredoxin subunit